MYNFSDLYNNPFHYVVSKNFLSLDEIIYIQKNLENISYEKATTYSDDGGSILRNSLVKFLPLDNLWVGLYQKILELVHQSNSYNWKFDLKEIQDSLQYTEYHAHDYGKFDWHVDCGNDNTSYRKISITIQLSDPSEYEGGDFELFGRPNDLKVKKNEIMDFPHKKMDKNIGTAIIFPSYAVHRVTPVTKGVRKSLVLWVGGKPFK